MKKNVFLFYLIFGLSLFVVGCSNQQPAKTTVTDSAFADPRVADVKKIQELLDEAAQSDSADQANSLHIEAAQLAMADNKLALANDIIRSIDETATNDEVRVKYIYTRSLYSFLNSDYEEALALLNSERLGLPELIANADSNLQSRVMELKARVFSAQKQYLSAARERIFTAPILDGDIYDRNHTLIWKNLLRADISQVDIEAIDGDYRGWLELSQIQRGMLQNLEMQLKKLKSWQLNWPEHPANKSMPAIMKALAEAEDKRPGHIAILLPLSGKYAALAKPVLEGILASRYWSTEQGEFAPVISVYDSSKNFLHQYQLAVRNQAELIIGPLLKEDLIALNQLYEELPVKTLALNYLPAEQIDTPKLVEFGLASEDEAIQIARQTFQDNLTRVAVLYPENAWGTRIADTFKETFYELGGTIVNESSYQLQSDYNKPIKRLLNLNKSQNRNWLVQTLAKEKTEFEPRRRQDIDYIFLIAAAKEATQIKPALNFHYAGDLPVFAMSNIYGGNINPERDRDLSGTYFVEIPWVIEGASPIKAHNSEYLPNATGKYQRMFAMGVDAYRLASSLSILESVDEGFLQGATGQLSLDHNQVRRQLNWAYIRRGRAVMIPKVSSAE